MKEERRNFCLRQITSVAACMVWFLLIWWVTCAIRFGEIVYLFPISRHLELSVVEQVEEKIVKENADTSGGVKVMKREKRWSSFVAHYNTHTYQRACVCVCLLCVMCVRNLGISIQCSYVLCHTRIVKFFASLMRQIVWTRARTHMICSYVVKEKWKRRM